MCRALRAAFLPCAAALTETEYAFLHLNTEKEVAQAVRNAFVKKVGGISFGCIEYHCPSGSADRRGKGGRTFARASHALRFGSPCLRFALVPSLRCAVQRGVALLCGAQLRGVHDPRAGARSTLEQAAKSGAARSPPAFLARPRACDSRSTPVSRLRSLALVVLTRPTRSIACAQGHHVYFYMGQMAVLLFKTG